MQDGPCSLIRLYTLEKEKTLGQLDPMHLQNYKPGKMNENSSLPPVV